MRRLSLASYLSVLLFGTNSLASFDSNGPFGINSIGLKTANGLPLNGGAIGSMGPVAIGQVERFRTPDPDVDTNTALTNSSTNPAGVFFIKLGPPVSFTPTANAATDIGPAAPDLEGQHALQVAGIMISTATDTPPTVDTPTGVATSAHLYSAGYETSTTKGESTAIAMQHIAAEISGVKVRAINFSAGFPLDSSETTDGNTLLTSFVDWSAHQHDVLYVIAGSEVPSAPIPDDNFNGITVAASAQATGVGVFDRLATFNTYGDDAVGDRTSVDLMAPGQGISSTTRNNQRGVINGTSAAAPHVTATVALLQQYANERIQNAGWNMNDSRRHEVIKAVLLNSADKIIDDGTFTIPGDSGPAPKGTFLGMERTVLDLGADEDGVNRRNWLQSDAYGDDAFSFPSAYLPLDKQMGAGHLNAKRAVRQFAPGEHPSDGAPVPVIGWDYGHTSGLNDVNKYVLSQPLLGRTFISITMAWDRKVNFSDTNSNGKFDPNETFTPYNNTTPPADSVINDLDLYLIPLGGTIDDAIATSLSNDSTIEHMFFRIPSTGQYEIWVNQFDADIPGGQDYAIAWWAAAVVGTSGGDYNGDNIVDAQDYNVWRASDGSTVTPGTGADGNNNGVIDAGDYVIWRKGQSAAAGSGASLASVPEPHAQLLAIVVVCACCCVRNRKLLSA